MSTTRERIGKQVTEVMQDLQEMREATQGTAGDELEQSRETDSECCEKERGNVPPAKCSLRRFIQELPIKSVLIAAGAGVLLGRFWTIRRR
jgi:ElaB/YqjD/DUF883 family membrane-anchored ribosome-binding protein